MTTFAEAPTVAYDATGNGEAPYDLPERLQPPVFTHVRELGTTGLGYQGETEHAAGCAD